MAYTDGMRKDWPVESVERELALAGFEEELDRADERGELGEADAGWWARWEGGTLDAELDHVLRTYDPG